MVFRFLFWISDLWCHLAFFFVSKYSPISTSLVLALKNKYLKQFWVRIATFSNELTESIWKEFWAKLPVCKDSYETLTDLDQGLDIPVAFIFLGFTSQPPLAQCLCLAFPTYYLDLTNLSFYLVFSHIHLLNCVLDTVGLLVFGLYN